MQQSIGQAIQDALDRKRARHEDLAEAVHVSRQLVGAWTRGERTPNLDDVAAMCRWFDDAQFYHEVASIATGGVVGGMLDGIDNSRASALVVAEIELSEAIDNLCSIRQTVVACPSRVDETTIMNVLMEERDAKVALDLFETSMCTAHQISLRQVSDRHHGRMLKQGYMRGRVA